MAYSSAVTMSVCAGSVHVLQIEVVGMKMAADVAWGDGKWEPLVNIFWWS